MKENTMLQEFAVLADKRKAEILELQTAYLLKQVENEMVQERFRACRNKVLSEYAYYAERDCRRKEHAISVGDRITDCSFEWLMSETAYDEYQLFCVTEYVKDNLTDADGCYTKEGNRENQLSELKEKLLRLGVEILPDSFPNKNLLQDAIKFKGPKSYETREKIFELVMKIS